MSSPAGARRGATLTADERELHCDTGLGPDTPAAASTANPIVAAWLRDGPNSARSVLVTILGDTVVPAGGAVWLGDLIALAEPFGFSDRLVRTSMFRLVSEGTVGNERIGRRSQYSLTPLGRTEFAGAEARIYRNARPDWTGDWTLVFIDAVQATPPTIHAELKRHLGWRGFTELSRGVYGSPNSSATSTPAELAELFDRLDIERHPPVATAAFDDLAPFQTDGIFFQSSGLAESEAGYLGFIERYRSVETSQLSPVNAFVLRTMIVHDLRRWRLREPELPADLVPPDWAGALAARTAGAIFRALADQAWRWVDAVTDLDPPADEHHRFAPPTTDLRTKDPDDCHDDPDPSR